MLQQIKYLSRNCQGNIAILENFVSELLSPQPPKSPWTFFVRKGYVSISMLGDNL